MTALDLARRRLLSMGGLALGSVAGSLGIAGCGDQRITTPAPPEFNRGAAAMAVVAEPPHARDEWTRLAAGNARFAAGESTHDRQDDPDHRRSQQDGAKPYACVVTCMDGRVPPELIFDAGLGDLVTIRTAGQAIDDAVVGSVEFAVQHLGVRLVLVMGHSDCAAVKAAIERAHQEKEKESDDQDTGGPDEFVPDDLPDNRMGMITYQLGYSVRKTPDVDDPEVYLAKCIGMQAVDATDRLRERSELLTRAIRDDEDPVSLVPVVYDISTGLIQRVTASRLQRP